MPSVYQALLQVLGMEQGKHFLLSYVSEKQTESTAWSKNNNNNNTVTESTTQNLVERYQISME